MKSAIILILLVLCSMEPLSMAQGMLSDANYGTTLSIGVVGGNFKDVFSQDNNLNNWRVLWGAPLVLSGGMMSGAANNQTLAINQTVSSSDTGTACASAVIGTTSPYHGGGVYAAVSLSDTYSNNYSAYIYWVSSSVGNVIQLEKSGVGWLGIQYPIPGNAGDTFNVCTRSGILSMSYNGVIKGTYTDTAPYTNLYPAVYFDNTTSDPNNGWKLSLIDGYTQTHNVLAAAMLSGSTSPCTGNCPPAWHTPSLTVKTNDNKYGGTVTGTAVHPEYGINLPNSQVIPLDEFVGTPGVVEIQGQVQCSVAGALPVSGNPTNQPLLVWTLGVDDGQSSSVGVRKVHSYCRGMFGNPNADFNPVEFWLPEGVQVSKYYYMRGTCYYLDNQGTLDPNNICQQTNEGNDPGDPRVHQIGWSSTPSPACCTKISSGTVCIPPTGHPEP